MNYLHENRYGSIERHISQIAVRVGESVVTHRRYGPERAVSTPGDAANGDRSLRLNKRDRRVDLLVRGGYSSVG